MPYVDGRDIFQPAHLQRTHTVHFECVLVPREYGSDPIAAWLRKPNGWTPCYRAGFTREDALARYSTPLAA